MSQHFLLTAARTVSLKQILRMEEAEAWTLFCSIRWPESDGVPVCPQCGCPACWACPTASQPHSGTAGPPLSWVWCRVRATV
jgi:hypothetical protein